jgi:glycosyltransferase involved in cell wall biosynthesis
MRLLLVIPNLVSYRSFLREMCRALVADGSQVHLACSGEKLWEGGEQVVDVGITMHAIEFARGMNPAMHLRAARKLDQLVEKLRPDLVHAHFSAAIFTTAIARTRHWPVTLATFHGVSFLAMSGWKATLLRALESWAARRFEAVWVLTDDDHAGLQAAATGAVVRRFPGFGVGCDVDRFTPLTATAREALRQKLGIAAGQVVFAFVGRFTDFKGFGLVVRAFLRLAKTNSTVRLLLIGSRDRLHGTGLDEPEEQALKNSPLVIDAGYQSEVERLLPAADVMVFPSRREGMPVCLMEALALGVPVITLATRGCRDVVRDGVDGSVLRDHDLQSITAAMERVAQDENLRGQWSACALADRERFDRAHFVAAQKQIYEMALSADHPAAQLAPTS